jgi:hypothetical protein
MSLFRSLHACTLQCAVSVSGQVACRLFCTARMYRLVTVGRVSQTRDRQEQGKATMSWHMLNVWFLEMEKDSFRSTMRAGNPVMVCRVDRRLSLHFCKS